METSLSGAFCSREPGSGSPLTPRWLSWGSRAGLVRVSLSDIEFSPAFPRGWSLRAPASATRGLGALPRGLPAWHPRPLPAAAGPGCGTRQARSCHVNRSLPG